jgi:biotin carboxylase
MGQTPLLFENALALEPRSALCIHYLQPLPGTVARITGKSAARSAPGVAHAEISIRRGTVIKPFASSHDRVGVIIAHGQSRPQARDNARRAAACLRIEYAKT